MTATHSLIIVYHSQLYKMERMATEIATGIRSVNDAEVKLICCNEAKDRMPEINAADAIIFGSPTYFGSISAEMKDFFDNSNVFRAKLWRNKIAAAFTHSTALNGDKLMTLMQIMIFAMQHGMIWVGQDLLPDEIVHIPKEWNDIAEGSLEANKLGSWIGCMSQSNSRNGVEMSKSDLLTARIFGQRIALVTKNFKR